MNHIKTYGGGRNSGPLQEEPTAFRPDSDLTTQKSEKYVTGKKLELTRQKQINITDWSLEVPQFYA